jgi:hypothetical protein
LGFKRQFEKRICVTFGNTGNLLATICHGFPIFNSKAAGSDTLQVTKLNPLTLLIYFLRTTSPVEHESTVSDAV